MAHLLPTEEEDPAHYGPLTNLICPHGCQDPILTKAGQCETMDLTFLF